MDAKKIEPLCCCTFSICPYFRGPNNDLLVTAVETIPTRDAAGDVELVPDSISSYTPAFIPCETLGERYHVATYEKFFGPGGLSAMPFGEYDANSIAGLLKAFCEFTA